METEQSGPLDARLELIPPEPGVYLMKDASGSIIYVGKAINLPRRLHSYFTAHPQGNAKVLAMISHIRDFSYVLCANELEALILENNLIKEYQPRYNILLRDDKEYPYLKITMNEPYPRVLLAYHIEADYKDGVRYFGPFLAGDLHRAIRAIYDIFPLKRCKRQLPRDIGKERPCLYYYLGRCVGPCLGTVPQSSYQELCTTLCDFLDGRHDPFSKELENQMAEASADLRFEEAAHLRDRLHALHGLQQRQIIASAEQKGNADILGYAHNESEAAVEILKVREGRMISAGSYFFPDPGENPEPVLEAFLTQYYDGPPELPPELILPQLPQSAASIQTLLEQRRGRRVHFLVPRRGVKAELLAMAMRNAQESLLRHTLMGGAVGAREEVLDLLRERLGLSSYLRRIEAYDIANMGDHDRAASLVVFIDGKPKRSAYRHFAIQTVQGQDDYASMEEVIRRRLGHLGEESFGETPDLILLDGGKGHLDRIAPILRELAPDIAVAAMVKDERHRSSAVIAPGDVYIPLRPPSGTSSGEGPEEAEDSRQLALLRLITAIQNEAHRFAGRLQKKLGVKRQLHWSLEEIPGVGPARRKLLLRHFASLKSIRQASQDELLAVPGLPETAARAVYRHFHAEEARS